MISRRVQPGQFGTLDAQETLSDETVLAAIEVVVERIVGRRINDLKTFALAEKAHGVYVTVGRIDALETLLSDIRDPTTWED